MPTLTSPGIEVTINDQSFYTESTPSSIPLFVVATRADKLRPGGTGIAPGTQEVNRLRIITSSRELDEIYGLPIFVTEDGTSTPIHGDETNEYGLLAARKFLEFGGSRAYVLRADVDLGALLPETDEPSDPPVDGTHWIDTTGDVGAKLKRWNGNAWVAVDVEIVTSDPTTITRNEGTWIFDYSTQNGVLMQRVRDRWVVPSHNSRGPGGDLEAGNTAPTNTDNVWYDTSVQEYLNLRRYSAVSDVFSTVPVISGTSEPMNPVGGQTVWEDISTLSANGRRPLKIYDGRVFQELDAVVGDDEPTTDPDEGTVWFDDSVADFGLYVKNANEVWADVTTVQAAPMENEKRITASRPRTVVEGAIWVDISTPENRDNFPVIRRGQDGDWVDITPGVVFSVDDPGVDSVATGTYWVNVGELKTRNQIKIYDEDFVADMVDGTTGAVSVEIGNNWRPYSSTLFGRKAVRGYVVEKLQAAVAINQAIRAEITNFQLIACPGYPELYDELVALNTDMGSTAFVVADTPKFMIPSGVPTGREVTVTDWVSNTGGASGAGEVGFSGSPSPYAGFWYPWVITTDTNGRNVLVPPSTAILRMMAQSDQLGRIWSAPAGTRRGRIDIATSAGYLDNSGTYNSLHLTTAMQNILYENDINPIVNKPSVGLLVNGQKTWLKAASALNRINVARLIGWLKFSLDQTLEPILFEPNDAKTRRQVTQSVERLLGGVKVFGGLHDYAVRCDATNNPASVRVANQLIVDVFLQPIPTIEFVHVPVTITSADGS